VTICPEDADAVRADDEMIERLRAGDPPPDPPDPLWALLAAWRDDVRSASTSSLDRPAVGGSAGSLG
jgi:hypothetical protein